MTKLTELRAKAEALVKGGREYYHDLKVLDVEEIDDFASDVTPDLVLALLDTIEELQNALKNLTDNESCSTDHNLFCQSHGSSYPCVMREAKEALAKLKERWG